MLEMKIPKEIGKKPSLMDGRLASSSSFLSHRGLVVPRWPACAIRLNISFGLIDQAIFVEKMLNSM